MKKKKKQPRSWKAIKSANLPKPDDFRCLLACMIEAAKGREISFTIEDQYGNAIPFAFLTDGIEIAGRKCEKEDVLTYIARFPVDFERLFFAAAKTGENNTRLVRRLQIAKLADMAGKKDKTANITMQVDGKMRTLSVSRKGEEPEYMLDGSIIERKEAESLIDREYISFLAGYKSAVKAIQYGSSMTERDGEQGSHGKKNRLPATKTNGNGKPVVDIEKILGTGYKGANKQTAKKMPGMLLGQEYLTRGKKGHVGIKKEGGTNAG